MRPRLKIYITLFIITAAMGFLLFAGFDNQTMVYYSTVKELKTKGASALDRGFRVGGKVQPGSVVKAGDKIQVQFDIVEDGETYTSSTTVSCRIASRKIPKCWSKELITARVIFWRPTC